MMSKYVQRAMQHNEKVIYVAQLHWIIYTFGIGVTALGAFMGFFLPMIVAKYIPESSLSYFVTPIRYLAVGFIILGAFQLLGAFIRQISTELVITDQRVIAKHGFISTTSYELMMMKVEGATIDQTITGRILGYGTLMVKGTGGGISPIDHVANPFLFHSFLMNALHAAQENANGGSNHHD
jgi:uncharacterized membrane protein YdbT with pleckstrin-like domain